MSEQTGTSEESERSEKHVIRVLGLPRRSSAWRYGAAPTRMPVISKEVRFEEPMQPDTLEDIAVLPHADPPGGYLEEAATAAREEQARRLQAGQK